MFLRTESFNDFLKFYPVIAFLTGLHIFLWLIMDVFSFPFAVEWKQLGVGNNFLVSQGEYWRLLTPIFLHAGLSHTLFNSFTLVLFGPALERMLGKVKFIIAYLLAGIAGNIGTYAADPGAFYSHLGASGAIFGLFGIYAYMLFARKDLLDQASSQIIGVIIVLGLIMTFLQPNINVLGHLFGFIGGLALAPPLLKNIRPGFFFR
ncbi:MULTISPECIES: rhomboid family intramembrane serine protease [Salimicrobium]|uniref:Rhomboid family intramembrane serine protease n=1 Tax=Salimicrobium humidisoli TaxID=2029857 RepID=A0ABX4HS95_9BACI|nr:MULTISPECIES: rhomboid family intramembrane serine protease [Salimicrobium]PBB06059.1 rhomboid family intramembrane serine protease [Salimicrobium humidisoli]